MAWNKHPADSKIACWWLIIEIICLLVDQTFQLPEFCNFASYFWRAQEPAHSAKHSNHFCQGGILQLVFFFLRFSSWEFLDHLPLYQENRCQNGGRTLLCLDQHDYLENFQRNLNGKAPAIGAFVNIKSEKFLQLSSTEEGVIYLIFCLCICLSFIRQAGSGSLQLKSGMKERKIAFEMVNVNK